MTEDDFPRLNMEDPQEPVPRMMPPPHTGFGSEEDSLSSFLYLMPRVPKTDYKKLMENDGVNLRFLAKLQNPRRVDLDRRFVITFYRNNDTIGVFERFERNSGFLGGKFLERSRQRNSATGEYFKVSDLFVGAKLSVNRFDFELIEADERTRHYIALHPELWGDAISSNQQPNHGSVLDSMSQSEQLQYQQA